MCYKASTNAKALQVASNAVLTVQNEKWPHGRRGDEQSGISLTKFLVNRRSREKTHPRQY